MVAKPLPNVGAIISPADSVCPETFVTLSGTGATSYSWTGNVTDGLAFIPAVTTTYTLTGTGANGCTNDYITTIMVGELPIFTLQPVDQVAYVDSTVQFITSSPQGSILQWQQDAGLGFINLSNVGKYSGVNTDTLTIMHVDTTINYNKYRCIGTSGTCADTTAKAQLVVNTRIAVLNLSDESSFTVYPNPASDKLYISLKRNKKSECSIRLMDMKGSIVIFKKETARHGSNLTELDLTNLAKGIYILSVVTDDMNKNAKVVIE